MLRFYVNSALVVLNVFICVTAYNRGDLQYAAFAALIAGICAVGAWMSWMYIKFIDSNNK